MNDLPVDSLGYDEESQSFVIIEYKREKNFSVIDQGFAYLALLLNNRADFTLLYNQKNRKSLTKDDIHWDQSRIIFLSTFYTYQRKAIELKDLPIELWEVKTYSNNTVLFNQIQHPEKGESIRSISQKSEVINKVNKEVLVSTEEMHLQNRPESLLRLYDELKENIFAVAQDITLVPKRVYIAFIRKTNFVDVVPRKSDIQLFLNLKKGTLDDPKKMARDISKLGHHGNGDYEVKLNNLEEIGYIMLLIRQSYDKN